MEKWQCHRSGRSKLDRSRYHGWEYREPFSHSRSQPNSSNRPSVVKKRMTRITISLSTVLTYWLSGVPVILRMHQLLHGSRADTSHGLLEITLSHLVLRRSFPPRSFLTIYSLMKENNSFLFSSFLRNPLLHSCFGI